MVIKTEKTVTRRRGDNTMLVLHYADSSISRIPHNFIQAHVPGSDKAELFIAKSSYIGPNSVCRFDHQDCRLNIGRYVSGAYGITFLPGGVHPVTTLSSYLFEQVENYASDPSHREDDKNIINVKNDVWIGDQCFILGGATVSNGCVLGTRTLVPHNKTLEPYGIYVGSPARLIRFRFTEKVRELLLELAWWEMPVSWIRENIHSFKIDLALDEGRSIETCKELLKQKKGLPTDIVDISAAEDLQTGAVEISSLNQAEDEKTIERIDSILAPLLQSSARIVVYPAGIHVNWLMVNTMLSRLNIVGFGDRDVNKHGRTYYGVPVVAPYDIQKFAPDIVLITSEQYGNDIRKELSRIVDGSKVKLVDLF